eukprot:CAMPEP_0184692194 /NCGR_PEP_ID=MMETSP0313-20130426/775_1 /TAXON_ID=2792 /ORGANISM="Porphyridium aerugineum, Strain SAG 1380-2" /LENGTH=362 /DNA_ID=CAMNT_0027150007 /DNA_START=153 /DNA_END=1241 /DNA_ORIENTATION=+
MAKVSAYVLALGVLLATATFASAIYAPDATDATFDSLIDGKSAVVMLKASWCGHCQRLEPEWELLGKAFEKSKDIVIIKMDAEENPEVAKRYNVEGYPTLKFIPKGKSDPADAEDIKVQRDAQSLLSYLNDRLGTSASLPKLVSKVVDLTAENFNKVVMDESKVVLVEFFAPWCGHCKSLKPKYDRLAEILDGEESIVIAALDADANRELAESFDVKGFPTLKAFLPGKKDEPLMYDRAREVKDLLEFLNGLAGTDYTPDGELGKSMGVIREWSTKIASALKADVKAASVSKRDLESSEHGKSKFADYYFKVLEKLSSTGKSYLDTEAARLEKLLDNSGLKPSQKKSAQKRLNVLKSIKDEL